MAYLELKSGKKMAVKPEQGLFLWKALHDPSALDEDQIEKIREVKAIYLNWHKAPDEYIRENLKHIIPMALNDWIYSRQGKPLRPQNDTAWKFAKRWGLWDQGGPSELVTRGMTGPTQTALAGGLKINDQ